MTNRFSAFASKKNNESKSSNNTRRQPRRQQNKQSRQRTSNNDLSNNSINISNVSSSARSKGNRFTRGVGRGMAKRDNPGKPNRKYISNNTNNNNNDNSNVNSIRREKPVKSSRWAFIEKDRKLNTESNDNKPRASTNRFKRDNSNNHRNNGRNNYQDKRNDRINQRNAIRERREMYRKEREMKEKNKKKNITFEMVESLFPTLEQDKKPTYNQKVELDKEETINISEIKLKLKRIRRNRKRRNRCEFIPNNYTEKHFEEYYKKLIQEDEEKKEKEKKSKREDELKKELKSFLDISNECIQKEIEELEAEEERMRQEEKARKRNIQKFILSKTIYKKYLSVYDIYDRYSEGRWDIEDTEEWKEFKNNWNKMDFGDRLHYESIFQKIAEEDEDGLCDYEISEEEKSLIEHLEGMEVNKNVMSIEEEKEYYSNTQNEYLFHR